VPKKKCTRRQQRKALGFLGEYLAKFGLQVDSRDESSGAVAFVSCRFCLLFGRESQSMFLAAGKRGPVSSVKHFRKPWSCSAARTNVVVIVMSTITVVCQRVAYLIYFT
jgi:hypothetical protein